MHGYESTLRQQHDFLESYIRLGERGGAIDGILFSHRLVIDELVNDFTVFPMLSVRPKNLTLKAAFYENGSKRLVRMQRHNLIIIMSYVYYI